MSKLIYAASLDAYKQAYPLWNSNTSPSYRSVVFTSDGYIVTHGTIMLTVLGSTENPYGLDFTLAGLQATVTISGASKSITLPVIGASNGTATNVAISNGILTVNHDNVGTAGVYGPATNSSTTITIPKLTINEQGHIIKVEDITATLNLVKRTASSGLGSLLFASASDGTGEVNYNTNIKVNGGSLYATTIYLNNKTLDTTYAEIAHKAVTASDTILGHVKLSDSTTSTNGVGAGIAATPKAVKDALDAAKALFASNDAMLFVGTINGSGVILTHNSNVITGVTNNTTNISALKNYSAGWTFRVTGQGGTITGLGNVESGDMVVCINNFNTSYKATDWSVIQANIDGAVTAALALTENQLILGDGARGLKSLAAGTDGLVLKMVGGKPSWAADTNTDSWRAINVKGTLLLGNGTNTGALNFVEGTGISLTGSGGSVTIATNLNALNVYSKGNAAVIGSYNPSGDVVGFDFTGGLLATLNSGKFTIGHSNVTPTTGTGGKLYAIELDSYGHITKTREVTSLASPNALTFGVGNSTTSYDGSSAVNLKIATAAGTDCSISATHSAGTVTLTPSITHKYRPIAFKATTLTAVADVLTTSSSGKLTLTGGSNVSISNNNGELTFSSVNSWRNVTAHKLSNNTSGSVLASTVGTADLEFGSDFLWDDSVANDGRLHIGWAEVDANGAITYTI